MMSFQKIAALLALMVFALHGAMAAPQGHPPSRPNGPIGRDTLHTSGPPGSPPDPRGETNIIDILDRAAADNARELVGAGALAREENVEA